MHIFAEQNGIPAMMVCAGKVKKKNLIPLLKSKPQAFKNVSRGYIGEEAADQERRKGFGGLHSKRRTEKIALGRFEKQKEDCGRRFFPPHAVNIAEPNTRLAIARPVHLYI
jgi:hypothetical protein